MQRRDFIRTAAGSALGLSLTKLLPGARAAGSAGHQPGNTPAASSSRPNILWITFEDTTACFLGCYGNKAVHTPNLDRLAAEGVCFDNAFSTAPVCSPSRAAIITGCIATTTGLANHRSRVALAASIKGFPYYLRKAGYFTSNNNKTDYNIANERRFTDEAWDECHGAGVWGTGYETEVDTTEPAAADAGWWHRKPGQPFFSVFNITTSHQSRTMTFPHEWYEKEILARLPESSRTAPDAVEMPPFYRDTPEMRRHFSRVANSLSLLDVNVGHILDRLKADGLADNTIVFCFADHGEGIPRAKTSSFGIGSHVPLIMYFPPALRHLSPWPTGGGAVHCDELVSTSEDVAPTLLSLAGIKPPAHMTGRALLGAHRAPPRPHVWSARDRNGESPDLTRSATDGRFFYTRVFMPQLPAVKYLEYCDISDIQRAIRADYRAGRLDALQASLVAPRQPVEHLYDLKNDPWETRNLAADPAHKDTLQKLRDALQAQLLATRDIHFMPEYEIMKRSAAGATAYEFRQQKDAYPFERILAAANLSGMGAAVAPEQVRYLKDPDATVRYWAAIGLDAQETLSDEHAAALQAALDDPHPCVQIAAAGTLYKRSADARAAEILRKHLRNANANTFLLTQTLQAIQYMRDKGAAFFPDVKALQARQKQRGFDGVASLCAMILHFGAGAPIYDPKYARWTPAAQMKADATVHYE